MLTHRDLFSLVDVDQLKKLIQVSNQEYALRNSIKVNDISYYAQADIAMCSRLFYYYFMKDCLKDSQKKEKFNSLDLNKYSKMIVDMCISSIDSRHKLIKTGLDVFSELSYTIEATLNCYKECILPYSKKEPIVSLMPDMFVKFFNQALGLLRMLNLDLASEAYSIWRTLHEAECVIKLLVEGGKELQDVYLRHLTYNNAFRGGIASKEETDEIFVEIKSNMAKHNLKSKDMKKYIEYGWLYASKSYHEDDVNYKLNFRNGLQLAAGLQEYNSWYEMASEMAHSSPIFFYSNNDFFSDLTSVNLADITLRAIKYFDSYTKQASIEFKHKDIKDILCANLEAQTQQENDSFYTKYKAYLADDDSSSEEENSEDEK
jgi:hypothetical protein